MKYTYTYINLTDNKSSSYDIDLDLLIGRLQAADYLADDLTITFSLTDNWNTKYQYIIKGEKEND